MTRLRAFRCFFVLALFLAGFRACAGATFRIAAYNVNNYIDAPTETRRFVKSDAAKAKIRESLLAAKADVVALEEMGALSALLELRDALKKDGLDYPEWEHISALDTNIHLAILSRFPIVARRGHTNENFLLGGRRHQVGRGFSEVEIKVNEHYTFTLIGAHLKSKRVVPEADESELRFEEARLLREKVDAVLKTNPNANLIVLGDLNDTKASRSTKIVIGTGRHKLVDTRPAERNGDNLPNPNPSWEPVNVNWTYYFGKEDQFSRIDYILLSPGMAREWLKAETYIPVIPNWGLGSDHRPIVATFEAADQ